MITANAGCVEVAVPAEASDAQASVVVLRITAESGSPAARMEPKVQ
jgi:hypothetical protein